MRTDLAAGVLPSRSVPIDVRWNRASSSSSRKALTTPNQAKAEPLRHLNLVRPAGFEEFFVEAGTRVEDTPRTMDPAALGVMANRYGVTLLGPPPHHGDA